MTGSPAHDPYAPTQTQYIHPSRGQLLIAIAAGTLMTAIATYLAVFDSDPFQQALGWLSGGLFGAASLHAVRRLVTNRPTLVLSPQGLTINLPFTPLKHLEWSEIERIDSHGSMGTLYLTIHLKDLKRTLARAGWSGSFLATINTLDSSTPFKVPERLVSMPLEELAKLIAERLENGRAPSAIEAVATPGQRAA